MSLTSFCAATLAALFTFSTNPLLLYDYNTNEYKDMSANPIILDMDFCGDVDDAVALRMATKLDSMHVCTLKAIGLSVTDPSGQGKNVNAAHGLLSYDGYGNIPIGTDSSGYKEETSKYWDVLMQYSTSEPTTKDAISLYKEVLSQSYENVTIITTGYLTNISNLIDDEEGYALVKDKCKKLVVMGGSIESQWENNFAFYEGAKKATINVCENFPGEIVFVPQELSTNISVGQTIQTKNKEDPVAKAISAWGSETGAHAFDPLTVLIGCLPEDSLPYIYKDVKLKIEDNGQSIFYTTSDNTNKRVVIKKKEISASQYQNMIEGIIS